MTIPFTEIVFFTLHICESLSLVHEKVTEVFLYIRDT